MFSADGVGTAAEYGAAQLQVGKATDGAASGDGTVKLYGPGNQEAHDTDFEDVGENSRFLGKRQDTSARVEPRLEVLFAIRNERPLVFALSPGDIA